MIELTKLARHNKACLHFADGRIQQFNDQQLAYAIWLALPKGVHAAFRSAKDRRPVYAWDYVDTR
jgi:hypothetical protein